MKEKSAMLISAPNRAQTARPPLGLMYIASYVRSKNIPVDLIDIKSFENESVIMDQITAKIKKKKPDVIGFTTLTTDIPEIFELAKRIKQFDFPTKIVLGGVHPSLIPEDIIPNKDIDYACVGEGELTIAELTKVAGDLEKERKVPGLVWNHNGLMAKSMGRSYIEDLDTLPFPAFDMVDMKFYLKPNPYVIRGVPLSAFYAISSRGCPYRCTYCANKDLFGQTFRARSPANVIEELELLKNDYKIDGVYFYDDTFTIDGQRVIKLCREMREKKLGLVWACETRVNVIFDKIVKEMSQAGCMQIDFGIESGSQYMLDKLKKDITLRQIMDAFAICKKYGIRQFANIMINLPGETREDLEYTKELIRMMNANITIFNVTTPFPGTDLYQEFGKNNLTHDDYAYMASKVDYNDFVNFIEKKCRMSKYDDKIMDVLDELWDEFPNAQSIRLNLNKNYIKGVLKALDFVKDKNYLKVMLRSKKKLEYVSWVKDNLLKRNLSTNAM